MVEPDALGLMATAPSHVHKPLYSLSQRQHQHPIGQGQGLVAGIDDPLFTRGQLLTPFVKPSTGAGIGGIHLHFGRDDRVPSMQQEQVNFCAGRRAPKGQFPPRRQHSGKLLHGKTLPAITGYRMSKHLFAALQGEQGMEDARVADVHLGGFGEAFSHVPQVGRQTPHEVGLLDDIEIAPGGRGTYFETVRQLAGIPAAPVLVDEHPQNGEQLRHALRFVDDDEFADLQRPQGVFQDQPVPRIL